MGSFKIDGNKLIKGLHCSRPALVPRERVGLGPKFSQATAHDPPRLVLHAGLQRTPDIGQTSGHATLKLIWRTQRLILCRGWLKHPASPTWPAPGMHRTDIVVGGLRQSDQFTALRVEVVPSCASL